MPPHASCEADVAELKLMQGMESCKSPFATGIDIPRLDTLPQVQGYKSLSCST